MNIFPSSSADVALNNASTLHRNLAFIFNSEVLRSDTIARRIMAGLPLCEGTADINILLEQLCTRLMEIEDDHLASIKMKSQTRRPTNHSRLKIRL